MDEKSSLNEWVSEYIGGRNPGAGTRIGMISQREGSRILPTLGLNSSVRKSFFNIQNIGWDPVFLVYDYEFGQARDKMWKTELYRRETETRGSLEPGPLRSMY